MFENTSLIEQGNPGGLASLALIIIVLAVCLTIVYISHKREKAILNDALEKEQAAKEEILALNEEIKKNEERMLSALEGSNDGVWDWNIKTNDYYINPGWEKKIGYKPGELKSKFKDYQALIHRDELPSVLDKIKKHLNGESSYYSDEYRLIGKDGSLIWVESRGRVIGHDDNGKPIYFIGVHNDITSRKESEEKQRLAIENQREHFIRLDQKHRELQRAQRDLKKAENKSRSIIEMAQDAIILINPLGKIVVWNRGAEHMFGYSAEEMNWAPLTRIIPDPKDTLLTSLRNIDQGKTIELEAVHKKGHTFPIELSCNSWESNDGSNYSLIIRDLTERKRMESALFRQLETIDANQNFLNTVLDAQQQMIMVIKDNEIEKVNRSFLDFFEVSELQEFTSRHQCISDTFSSEVTESNGYLQNGPGSRNWLEYVLENPGEAQKVIIKKGRKPHIFTVNAVQLAGKNKDQIVAVFSDVTELEEAKNTTEKAYLFTEQLIDGLPTPFYYQDKNFIFQKVNAALCSILGKSQKEMINRGIHGIIDEDLAESYHLSDLRMQEMPDQMMETWVKHTDGSVKDVILYKTSVYDKEKKFDGIIGLMVDISARKKAEKELAESQKMMTDSIEYSSLIQRALIPGSELFNRYFDDFFAIWQPRDVVGGDIYFFEELRHEKECLLMVIDCTGHGVPGAFVTMLVKAVERQIVNEIMLSDSEISPAQILSVFNRSIKTLLKQHNRDAISNAGFDGGVLYINYEDKILKFAGSETPLFIVQDDRCSMIKGDRHSIGYISSDINYVFTDRTIPMEPETRLYLTTDGFFDQSGGEKGFRYGKKRFIKLIEENYKRSFSEQRELFLSELQNYKGNEIKNDDMTVIGLKL